MNKFQWRRVVIKVGSALIAPDKKGCSSRYLLSIAQFILRCRMHGIEVVLVSSGSVAAGAHFFAESDRKDIAIKKAMAAAGQTSMMATWDRFFDFPCAQILLTHADLTDRERYESIRETMFSLLNGGLLPIINENDTVTTDELKVGDNDNLAAMVAAAADADTLIICSDVNGLYDKNPNQHDDAKLINWVTEITPEIYAMAGGADSSVGTGGMKTKIEAAEKATSHGISTFIVNGFEESSFNDLLNGRNPGTLFQPYKRPLQERLHWLTHTSKEQGELIVQGSFDEPLDKNSSQLTSDGIVEVRGEFAIGDTILVRSDDGTRLAKATSNYSSCMLSYISEQESEDLNLQPGPIISDEDIAILEKQ
ncbi:glutamate 5-kinase [Neptunicella sp. SCSIO 80796]|uniref:glutamate 5-kinase n=1 Tax=Neptunicella plasticusilytica TaxID=3117012 RepID=UPI003A4E40DF